LADQEEAMDRARVELSEAEAEALARVAADHPEMLIEDIFRMIIRDWLIGAGYLQPPAEPPEGLDPANDD
jgi:hypothetical protein